MSLGGHERSIASAEYSPDGRRILTAAADATARLWDAATGQELRVLRGHEAPLWTGVFSPDGSRILDCVGGQDRAPLGCGDRSADRGAARP